MKLGLVILFTLLAIISQPTSAEVICKGLDTEMCEMHDHCRWINGYERKDGKTVEGYCRTKNKKHSEHKKVDDHTNQKQNNQK